MSVRRVETDNAVYYVDYINWATHSESTDEFLSETRKQNNRKRGLEKLFLEIQEKEAREVAAFMPEMRPLVATFESELERELGKEATDYLRQHEIPIYLTDVPSDPYFVKVDSGQEIRTRVGQALLLGGLTTLACIPGAPVFRTLFRSIQKRFPENWLLKERHLFGGKNKKEEPVFSRREFLKLAGIGVGLVAAGTLAYPTALYAPNYFGGEEGSVRSALRNTGAAIHSVWPSWNLEGRSAVRAKKTDQIAELLYQNPELGGEKPIILASVGADHGEFETYLTNRPKRDAMLKRFEPTIKALSIPYHRGIGQITWKDGKPYLGQVEIPLM